MYNRYDFILPKSPHSFILRYFFTLNKNKIMERDYKIKKEIKDVIKYKNKYETSPDSIFL